MATRNIDENQMNGKYHLYSISVRDDAYRNNSIEYREDGTTQTWDGVNNTWIYGEHDFDFGDQVITIDGGVPPQTDFTPPELISFKLESDEVSAGKRLKIDYEANDKDSGLREITFRFQNETGDSISIRDSEQDGMAIRSISESQMQGSYTLYAISISDTAYRNNSIEYKADGTTQIWDSVNNTWIYGEHNFDFSSDIIKVTAPVPDPNPQTDFSHPELISFKASEEVSETDRVGKHEWVKFNYVASDGGSGINTVEFQFQNENNNTIYFYDHDEDGIISARMEDWYSEGTYQLYRIQLRDDAFQQNRITFRDNGTTEYNNRDNNNEYGIHEFDFSTLSFTYGEEREPQTDFTPPELVSFDFISVSAVKGDRSVSIILPFDAASEIDQVEFQFRNEDNNTIYLYDHDDDGVASTKMEDWYREGTYKLYSIVLRDDEFDDNKITYKQSGRTEYYDRDFESNLNGVHDFDFSNISFTYTKTTDPQTD